MSAYNNNPYVVHNPAPLVEEPPPPPLPERLPRLPDKKLKYVHEFKTILPLICDISNNSTMCNNYRESGTQIKNMTINFSGDNYISALDKYSEYRINGNDIFMSFRYVIRDFSNQAVQAGGKRSKSKKNKRSKSKKSKRSLRK